MLTHTVEKPVKESLKKAVHVELMHAKGYVYMGIYVHKIFCSLITHAVRILDFDWAGEHRSYGKVPP